MAECGNPPSPPKNDIDELLEKFYRFKVAIKDKEKKRMDIIYQELKRNIQESLDFPFKIGTLIDRGSSPEKLKVIRQDEYDVLIPLQVSGSYWTFVTYDQDPRFMWIKQRGKDPKVPEEFCREGCLSAAAVRNKFVSAIGEAWQELVDW